MALTSWYSAARASAAWLLLLAPAVAQAGDPTWKVVSDTANRRYAIRVAAGALGRDEYVSSARCTVALLDADGHELATKTHEMATVQSGESRTEEFSFERPEVSGVRGKIMDWVVSPKGSIVGMTIQEGKSRSGSSPPE